MFLEKRDVFLLVVLAGVSVSGRGLLGQRVPTVTITPNAPTVLPSARVLFRATIEGHSSLCSQWQVNNVTGGNPDIGLITPEGLYTAPQDAAHTTGVVITCGVSGNPEISGSAHVLIGRKAITVRPSSATAAANGQVEFTVDTILGVGRLRWQVNGADGGNPGVGTVTFSGDGNRAIYKAPKDTGTVSSVSVTALSEDGLFSGTSSVVIAMPLCSTSHCIKIGLADYPSSTLSSFPLTPHKIVRFAAYSIPDHATVPVSWTVNDDPVGTGPIGIIHPEGSTVTYIEPTEMPVLPIVLKATPTDPSYSPATLNIIVTPQILIRCAREDVRVSGRCTVTDFDRLVGETGEFPARPRANAKPVNERTDAGIVSAINSSKTIYSGSVISAETTGDPSAPNCTNYDWKIAVQSEESTGILVYDPSDVGSGVCEGNRFILALPVHVLWADLFGYHQNLDPTRSAPAKPSGYGDCAGQPAPTTIAPCDKDTSGMLVAAYRIGALLNPFTPPGNGQGSINFAGKGEISFDAQADPALKKGKGWINFPVVFERGATGANLNSLGFAAAYDFRWIRYPDFWKPSATSGLILRKPQVQIRSGAEFSPSHPAAGMAPTLSHDWNYVWGEVVRFPVVVNFHDQPSSLTIYPVVGGEEGWHLASNLAQHDPIVRGVTGVDGSFRWPFNVTHNFVGSTPIGIEAQYRIRELAYKEPFADFANLPASSTPPPCPTRPGITPTPAGTACMAAEVLSSIPRSFVKADMTIPLDPYVQLKFTFYRGSLPPDFWNLGRSYTLGLSFGNPGSSEH
jgi:hypothetical protein